MTDVNGLLHRFGYDELRREDENTFSELNGHLQGRTTDELDLILRPADQDGIAHVLGPDGNLFAAIRKIETDPN